MVKGWANAEGAPVPLLAHCTPPLPLALPTTIAMWLSKRRRVGVRESLMTRAEEALGIGGIQVYPTGFGGRPEAGGKLPPPRTSVIRELPHKCSPRARHTVSTP